MEHLERAEAVDESDIGPPHADRARLERLKPFKNARDLHRPLALSARRLTGED